VRSELESAEDACAATGCNACAGANRAAADCR
jgi:hypothetical protein